MVSKSIDYNYDNETGFFYPDMDLSTIEPTTQIGRGGYALVYANGIITAPRSVLVSKRNNVAGQQTKIRQYKWKSRSKRIYLAKVAAIGYNAPNKRCYFITLTCPQSVDTNEAIGKFILNMRKRGYIYEYAWVRERHKKGGNHYHLIYTSNEIHFSNYRSATCTHRTRSALADIFGSAWNSAMLSSGGKSSTCSVRFGTRPVVSDVAKVANYCGKYCTKGQGIETFRLSATTQGLRAVVSIPNAHIFDMGRVYSHNRTEFCNTWRFSCSVEWWSHYVEIFEYDRQQFKT